MMPAWLSLLVDLVIAGLLVATIVYAVQLNRRIGLLRDGKEELEKLLGGFAEATQRAQVSVDGMRRAAGETGQDLQSLVAKAQELRDELKFIMETAEGVANRLEQAGSNAARQAAPAAATMAAPTRPAASQPISVPVPKRPVVAGPAAGPVDVPPGMGIAPVRGTPIAVKPAEPAEGAPAPVSATAEARSRAERELIEALEKMQP
jgi:hypothetical protein